MLAPSALTEANLSLTTANWQRDYRTLLYLLSFTNHLEKGRNEIRTSIVLVKLTATDESRESCGGRCKLWRERPAWCSLSKHVSLSSGLLQTAADACGNRRAHANEIKRQRRNGGRIHLCGVNTITEMTVCVFPSSEKQQEGPLAGVNNPVCAAGRDWLGGCGGGRWAHLTAWWSI